MANINIKIQDRSGNPIHKVTRTIIGSNGQPVTGYNAVEILGGSDSFPALQPSLTLKFLAEGYYDTTAIVKEGENIITMNKRDVMGAAYEYKNYLIILLLIALVFLAIKYKWINLKK